MISLLTLSGPMYLAALISATVESPAFDFLRGNVTCHPFEHYNDIKNSEHAVNRNLKFSTVYSGNVCDFR